MNHVASRIVVLGKSVQSTQDERDKLHLKLGYEQWMGVYVRVSRTRSKKQIQYLIDVSSPADPRKKRVCRRARKVAWRDHPKLGPLVRGAITQTQLELHKSQTLIMDKSGKVLGISRLAGL